MEHLRPVSAPGQWDAQIAARKWRDSSIDEFSTIVRGGRVSATEPALAKVSCAADTSRS